ncbi:invasion associated locus B family protein [Roseovarius spongiae]|nr:invasion associated locus B family protein [Roseovarius spongiae]
MPRSLTILSFAAALALGQTAVAQQDGDAAASDEQPAAEAPAETQETAPEAETPAPEAAGDDAATDSGFSQGREVAEAEDPTYIKEKFGDWSLRCFRAQEGEDPCQLYQLLREKQGNPVAEFSIFDIKDQGPIIAGGTIMVPLFTLLTEELKISVDGAAAKSYPYRVCTETGCIAQIGLTAEDISAFKRGAKATLTLVPAQAPDQKVRIDVSLSGFTKGYDSVSLFTE